MSSFVDKADGMTDFGQIAWLFESHFYEAARTTTLAAFHQACLDGLRRPTNPRTIPYAFAYAARGRLQDITSYQRREDRIIPKPALIETLDSILREPMGIDCRDNYYYPVLAGITHYIQDDYPAAYAEFASAARYSDFYRIIRCDFGGGASFARSFPSLAELDRQADRFDTDVSSVRNGGSPHEICISISFDRIYAMAFAEKWMDGIERTGDPGIALHLHIIFLNIVDDALLERLQAKARGFARSIEISHEVSGGCERAYFASARLIRAARVVERYDCNVLFCDADAYIDNPAAFATLMGKMKRETRLLGLLATLPYHGYLPWRRLSATWLMLPNTGAGLRFGGLVGKAISYLWDARADRNWWIDQLGLETARLLYTAATGDEIVDIYDDYPDLMRSSEAYKIDCVSKVPDIAALMAEGHSFKDAVHIYSNNASKKRS